MLCTYGTVPSLTLVKLREMAGKDSRQGEAAWIWRKTFFIGSYRHRACPETPCRLQQSGIRAGVYMMG